MNNITKTTDQDQCAEATPHCVLIADLMDPRVAKTEREHAAALEIEQLRAGLAFYRGAVQQRNEARRVIEKMRCDLELLQRWHEEMKGVRHGCEQVKRQESSANLAQGIVRR